VNRAAQEMIDRTLSLDDNAIAAEVPARVHKVQDIESKSVK
jgi:hypothetical protein